MLQWDLCFNVSIQPPTRPQRGSLVKKKNYFKFFIDEGCKV